MAWSLMKINTEKAKAVSTASASVCMTNAQDYQAPGSDGMCEARLSGEGQGYRVLKLDIHKQIRPNRQYPWVLREQLDLCTRLFLIVFERSWQLGHLTENWKKANVTVFKREYHLMDWSASTQSISSTWSKKPWKQIPDTMTLWSGIVSMYLQGEIMLIYPESLLQWGDLFGR